jgi:hypothetical protein
MHRFAIEATVNRLVAGSNPARGANTDDLDARLVSLLLRKFYLYGAPLPNSADKMRIKK